MLPKLIVSVTSNDVATKYRLRVRHENIRYIYACIDANPVLETDRPKEGRACTFRLDIASDAEVGEPETLNFQFRYAVLLCVAALSYTSLSMWVHHFGLCEIPNFCRWWHVEYTLSPRVYFVLWLCPLLL